VGPRARDREVAARRRSAACSLGAAGVLGVLAAHQLGLVRHLPNPPPDRLFDSDRVSGSGEAYWIGSTPDTTIGIANYAVSAWMAPRGGRLWQAKLAVDAAYSLVLAVEQPLLYRRLCWYCLTVTGFSVAAYRFARS
jgi:uncharacterized membrane protein